MENKVFYWTEKQLRKSFSEATINKYGNLIGKLFQNGLKLNCRDEEVEEQLQEWNFLQSEEDLQKVLEIVSPNPEETIGTKIISEELYFLLKESSFCEEENNPLAIKRIVDCNIEKISAIINDVQCLLQTKDIEIHKAWKKFPEQFTTLSRQLDTAKKSFEEGKKVVTFINLSSLRKTIYSSYLYITKNKANDFGIVITSNIADEIYGSLGGYNPNTNKIICIVGSAVWNLKSCYKGDKARTKKFADTIFYENPGSSHDDEHIQYLSRWRNGEETDDEYAKQIVTNCLLNGIFNLLLLKHGVCMLNKSNDCEKENKIKNELKQILQYCKIPKDYLL